MLIKIGLVTLIGSATATFMDDDYKLKMETDKLNADMKKKIITLNRNNAAKVVVKATTPVDLKPSADWDISKATTC